MTNTREKSLWKEIDKFAFWASALGIVLLTILYFFIAGVWTDETNVIDVAQTFAQSVIANLIPVLILFIGSYAFFRRIQALRAEKEAEELSEQVAEKVAERVLQLASQSQSDMSSLQVEQQELSAEQKYSVLVQREFQITNKFFDDQSTPQKIIIEFTNRGSMVFQIMKIKLSATQELSESAFSTLYQTENGGRFIIIPFDPSKSNVSPGGKFIFEINLAQKWEVNRINGLAGKWGYLKPNVIYDGKLVELFYSI